MLKQRQKSKGDVTSRRPAKHSDSDEDAELLSLRKKSPRKEIPYLEKKVDKGDTLQSLAISHSCTIEDLKRLNNIHKENEIFAKAVIKVPNYPISMALAGVHASGDSSPHRPSTCDDTLIDSRKVAASLKAVEVNEIIFNSNIVQQPKPPVTPPNRDFDEDDETVNLLPANHTVRPPPWTVISFSGIDGDISLKGLIVCIAVLIVLVPLIYVFYIYEHPESFHDHDS